MGHITHGERQRAHGGAVVQFSDELIERLRPHPLLGAPRGPLVLRYVQDPRTTADVRVTIEVYAEDAARTLGRVRVGVDIPGRDPLDLAGCGVVLRIAAREWRAETDEAGVAIFAAVPLSALAELRVEIEP